jgi:hypothetical protein
MSQLDRHDRIMSAVRGSIMSGVIVSSVELRRERERELLTNAGLETPEIERIVRHG